MSWSYTGNPASSNKDLVRYLIGDTDSGDQLLQDEEIDFVLGQYAIVTGTPVVTVSAAAAPAAECCDNIVALYSRTASQKEVGGTRGVKVQASNRVGQYEALAEKLRRKMAMVIYIGGVSEADKEAYQSDTDAIQPFFSRGMMRENLVSASSSQSEADDVGNSSDDE